MSPGARELGRIADALFAQAKVQREQLKLTDRQVIIQERLLELQEINIRVTRALEAKLLEQANVT